MAFTSQRGEYDKAADELRRDYPGLTAEFAGWFPYAAAASAEAYNARAGIDLLRQLLAQSRRSREAIAMSELAMKQTSITPQHQVCV